MFLWKEVYVTQDQSKLNTIKKILSSHGIESYTKTSDRSAAVSPLFAIFGTRRTSGTFSENRSIQITYYIYVRRKDFSLSKSIIK